MRKGINIVLIIPALLLALMSGQAPAQDKSGVDPAVRKALWTAVSDHLNETDTEKSDQDFLIDFQDLNMDGLQDALVVLRGTYWCGTGGCTMWVFQGKTGSFQLVSEMTLIRTPMIVSDIRTNGWHDLIVNVSGGGAKPKTVALKFDGKKYPHNPSMRPPVAGGNQKGATIFPEDMKPVAFGE